MKKSDFRLLTTCPVHNVPLPPCGEPWTCGYCGYSFALADARTWVRAFKRYPGGLFLTWTEAEMRAYLAHSDNRTPAARFS
jgi:hypothetical protein